MHREIKWPYREADHSCPLMRDQCGTTVSLDCFPKAAERAKYHQILHPTDRCVLFLESGCMTSDAATYLLRDPVVHSLSHLVDQSDKVLVVPSWLVQVKRSLQNFAQPLGAFGIKIHYLFLIYWAVLSEGAFVYNLLNDTVRVNICLQFTERCRHRQYLLIDTLRDSISLDLLKDIDRFFLRILRLSPCSIIHRCFNTHLPLAQR